MKQITSNKQIDKALAFLREVLKGREWRYLRGAWLTSTRTLSVDSLVLNIDDPEQTPNFPLDFPRWLRKPNHEC